MKMIKEINGKSVKDFVINLGKKDILQIASIFLIRTYPELNGLSLDIQLDFNKSNWRISVNGIYPKDTRTSGNGENNELN